LHYWV